MSFIPSTLLYLGYFPMPQALERLEVCELMELHLLVLVNLGKLVIFMEKNNLSEKKSS